MHQAGEVTGESWSERWPILSGIGKGGLGFSLSVPATGART